MALPALRSQDIRDRDSREDPGHSGSSQTATEQEDFQGITLVSRLKGKPVRTGGEFHTVAAALRQIDLHGRRQRKHIEWLPRQIAEALQDLQVYFVEQLGYTLYLG